MRWLREPIFILSAVRSGSTLLRTILGAHSALYTPHELHLKDIAVSLNSPFARLSMNELGLTTSELEYLLWDRLMYEQLCRSGKRTFVNKTPTDVFIWARIAECWPDARFIFLLRHPAAVAASWCRAQVHWGFERAVDDALRYFTALDEARRKLPGLTVRYEHLAARPAPVVHEICAFLGIDWEPGMLAYQVRDFKPGIGDWGEKIHSGRPHPAPPPPSEIPGPLREICRTWGYA